MRTNVTAATSDLQPVPSADSGTKHHSLERDQ